MKSNRALDGPTYCYMKSTYVKPGLGLVLVHLQAVKIQIRTRRLIRVCTICLNCRKLRVKWNSLVPIQDYFPSIHSETTDPPVLSVIWFFTCWELFCYYFIRAYHSTIIRSQMAHNVATTLLNRRCFNIVGMSLLWSVVYRDCGLTGLFLRRYPKIYRNYLKICNIHLTIYITCQNILTELQMV